MHAIVALFNRPMASVVQMQLNVVLIKADGLVILVHDPCPYLGNGKNPTGSLFMCVN